MKIGIISDSPTLTTGFGITTSHIAEALIDSGHDVVCFGLKGDVARYNSSCYSFAIWPIDVDKDWSVIMADFLMQEDPDALLINMDIFNLREVLAYCGQASWNKTIIAYLIFDGLPVYRQYLEGLRTVDIIITSTHASARYLSMVGITATAIAPPGVDLEVFRPLPHASELRQQANLQSQFVVGVFGRNTERKQQARVLRALAYLKERGVADDLTVYFHCRKHGYWYLDEIAAQLGVKEHVLFADDITNEMEGVPYKPMDSQLLSINYAGLPSQKRMPSTYSYVERLNCCDLVVNVAHCGDFEQVLIEAPACGVPVAATNDGGIMREAMGDGGILLDAADINFWNAGQRCFYVSPHSIAQAIQAVRNEPELHAILKAKGSQNSQQYPWSRLRDTVVQVLADIQSVPPKS